MICLVAGGQYFVLTDGRRRLISKMRSRVERAMSAAYDISRAVLMPTNSTSTRMAGFQCKRLQ